MNNSYVAGAGAYVKGDFAITSTGVVMKGTGRAFTVNPAELEWGDTIGQGASGTVRRSRHTPTGTILALKLINMFDKAKREQLMREIHALFDSECPCLVTFYGAFLKDSAVALALEYMDCGSLENVVRGHGGGVPEPVLANITLQLLIGLSYLKSKKRVHRDIKPSNILLNTNGEAKLTDFGIATELCNSIAMCGTFVGTFKYMSPERIRRDPYSYASDIWSLGLVLMETATGQYPYHQHRTTIEMIQSVLEAPPPPLSEDAYSPAFCAFLHDCLRTSDKDRKSVDELLASPWLAQWGATDLDAAQRNVRTWIQAQQNNHDC
ncbi:STE/STE7 protein kinase [Saprolegnia parasitica CBS 223.65]|uniref:mitogen-activated protein kinase kinase n=1 Tax=Saprolegnia parasitica (strain CBS 223.65) TaxID=695850 RepID=A0A067D5H3_SAPPC|nr:STE/STE7 protein kinase [Saprolegnia parasitica CBS 223.65]KDO34247.1 STE/STE7 protein kinase [Saprolegnia parasitica CBS 223.65]|eukprot:XP_012195041.1 STE/STE7 protein kinase [Saprolegnia parasitica CBS 223.65]